MADAPPPRIGDLAGGMQRLEIYCQNPACRRTVVHLTPAEAIARFGAAATFAEAEQRVRCSACGQRRGHCRGSMVDYYFHHDLDRGLRQRGPMPTRIPAWLLAEHAGGRWKSAASAEQLAEMEAVA